MSKLKDKRLIKKNMLEMVLTQLRMARRRAGDDAARVEVIAQEEQEIAERIKELNGEVVAA